MNRTSRRLLTPTALALVAALFAGQAIAGPKEDERATNAVRVLNEIQRIPENGIPDKLLDEGKVEGETVQCPWHDSVFNLTDGSIVHGPTAFPVTCYQARRRNGKIEIRARQPEAAEGQEAEEETQELAYA